MLNCLICRNDFAVRISKIDVSKKKILENSARRLENTPSMAYSQNYHAIEKTKRS